MTKRLTTKQFIERAKKIHGEKYDYSKVEYKNVDTKVCIICSEHGEFWQTPYNHVNLKHGCRKCAGNQISSTFEFIQKAKLKHDNKYDYSQVEYVNCKTKVKIICPEHGVFEQTPSNHLQGQGCSECAKEEQSSKQKLTTKQFIKKAKQIHGNKYDYLKVEYIDSQTKVCIICPIHGEFQQKPANHLFGEGCRECANNKLREERCFNLEEFIQKAREAHGGKYDYSQVDYKGNDIKIYIICPKHGLFEQTPKHHLAGHGCKKCAGEQSSQKQRLGLDKFVNRARKIHGNKYDYSEVIYINEDMKVKIICSIHGIFEQSPCSHLQGNGCPKCGKNKLKMSLIDFIDNSNIIHNNKYDYSKVEYVNINTKVKIICPIHGEFEQNPHNHLAGHGCPICGVESQYQTKKQNGTLNTSQPEENLYKLLIDKFGIDDVIRQYKESRYPYSCDFYIKSLDLFVELNANWTHGHHWFDKHSKQDLKVLNEWTLKSKNQPYYKNAIQTWTQRDIKKRDTAIQNNLNYKVFWDNGLTDAKKWLSSI